MNDYVNQCFWIVFILIQLLNAYRQKHLKPLLTCYCTFIIIIGICSLIGIKDYTSVLLLMIAQVATLVAIIRSKKKSLLIHHQSYKRGLFVSSLAIACLISTMVLESFLLFLLNLVLLFWSYLELNLMLGIPNEPVNEHDNWQALDLSLYETFKKNNSQYSEEIETSLSLDEFTRYKIERSYEKQEISVLKEKSNAGSKLLCKGAYGILLVKLALLEDLHSSSGDFNIST